MNRQSGTIPGLLLDGAARFGARPAVLGLDGPLTYAELQARVLRAASLLGSVGVARGDRVALWLPNGPDFIEAALAISCLGALLLPVSTRLKGDEVAYILGKARPTALIGVGQFLGTDYGELLAGHDLPSLRVRFRVGPGQPDWLEWASATAGMGEVRPEEILRRARAVRPDDVAEVMFTSGTTGFPKGAMLRHGQIVQAYRLWAERLGMSEADSYLIIAPMFHSFGYKAGVLASLAVGAAMLPLPIFEAAQVLDLIERHRISVTGGPPTIFMSLLAENESAGRDLSSLRAVGTGGSIVPAAMVRKLHAIGVGTVLNAYGLTETTALVAATGPGDDAETVAGTSGRAIPDVELRCALPDGQIAAPGEAGEIQVRGFNVMAGYFEDEEATRQAFTADGWLRTGDIGVLDEAGYLRVTDRLKDMFIVGGFNCYPAELERIIGEHADVREVAVVGVPDERMGEVGKAFIVARKGGAFERDDFLAWCRGRMANYKVPRHIELVESLPRNAMGKVQKFVLRDRSSLGGDRAAGV